MSLENILRVVFSVNKVVIKKFNDKSGKNDILYTFESHDYYDKYNNMVSKISDSDLKLCVSGINVYSDKVTILLI